MLEGQQGPGLLGGAFEKNNLAKKWQKKKWQKN